MVASKTHKWELIVYTDASKHDVARVLPFETMRDMALAVGCTHSILSNYYHDLINARGNCKYVCIKKRAIVNRPASETAAHLLDRVPARAVVGMGGQQCRRGVF